VNLCPQFADLRTRLAVLHRDSGRPERAREQLELARAANPHYAQARLLLGVMMLSGGELEGAAGEFETVLERDPDNKGAQMYLRLVKSRLASSERPLS
jgi:lipoprotein NlpI